MYAKYIFNVDGADSTNVITKPVGQKLEIVPQVNPATVKPEECSSQYPVFRNQEAGFFCRNVRQVSPYSRVDVISRL